MIEGSTRRLYSLYKGVLENVNDRGKRTIRKRVIGVSSKGVKEVKNCIYSKKVILEGISGVNCDVRDSGSGKEREI